MPGILYADKIKSRTGGTLVLNGVDKGFIWSMNTIRYGTRTAVGGAKSAILFSGTFYKFRDDTDIVATCTVFGDGYNSGNCGTGMVLDNTSWDYGTAYQYDGAWSATQQTTMVFGTAQWRGVAAGNHLVGFGWNSISTGSTAEKPFNYINPNSSNGDARNQQMVSSIVVYEILRAPTYGGFEAT